MGVKTLLDYFSKTYYFEPSLEALNLDYRVTSGIKILETKYNL